METEMVLVDSHSSISPRDAEANIHAPVWMEVPISRPWDGFATSAISTREDVPLDVKKQAWAAFTATGCRVYSYEAFENIAVKHAKSGIDPRESVLPAALTLPDHAYRKLEAFVRELEIVRPTRRRRKAVA